MPIPVAIIERRVAQKRMAFIQELLPLAHAEVASIVSEVLIRGGSYAQPRVAAVAFQSYCDHLMHDRIPLSPGQYQPHALYMRSYMLPLVRHLKSKIYAEEQIRVMREEANRRRIGYAYQQADAMLKATEATR